MYKKILRAIETSQEGKMVLTKASRLAEIYDAKLISIHVLPYTLLPSDYQKKLQSDISPKLEKIASDLNISKKNCLIKVGKPYQLICKEVFKKKADLVIIGTHSKKGLHAAIGSTATGVANKRAAMCL
ncbi:MAG: universal stress protein [Pseudohongiellaceae bacterium]